VLLRLSVWAALGCCAADGSRFDQDALTAAHKTPPFGTRVRVICAATSRSIVVRITDRGPFIAGRAIDLLRNGPSACRVSAHPPRHLRPAHRRPETAMATSTDGRVFAGLDRTKFFPALKPMFISYTQAQVDGLNYLLSVFLTYAFVLDRRLLA
jgi:hypothetical protein